MAMALKAAERPAERMDRIDRKIVFELQRDATLSVAQLAERVGLSQTPCWRRVQKLEQAGVITGRVALVEPSKIGLGLTVCVAIEAADHSPARREAFARAVAEMPEVIEGHRMAGDVDYLLKVVMPDMPAFDDFYKRLTARLELKNVTSQFAMERMKGPAPYPIDTTEP